MKKLVTIAAVMSMFSSVAFAGQQIQGTVVGMTETYRDVVKEVPQVCEVVEVPVNVVQVVEQRVAMFLRYDYRWSPR